MLSQRITECTVSHKLAFKDEAEALRHPGALNMDIITCTLGL